VPPPLQFCEDELDSPSGRVSESAELGSIGLQLAEQLQLFRRQLSRQEGVACDVRTGPVEAGYETQCDWVTAGDKDDWYGSGRCLRRQRCGGAEGYDHSHAATDEIGCQRR
jgi:hypothetical protein